jgi:hypothetical protein
MRMAAITEPQLPQLKETWSIFFCKKWTDSVNAKKFWTEMFSSRSTLNNCAKQKNTKQKNEVME